MDGKVLRLKCDNMRAEAYKEGREEGREEILMECFLKCIKQKGMSRQEDQEFVEISDELVERALAKK